MRILTIISVLVLLFLTACNRFDAEVEKAAVADKVRTYYNELLLEDIDGVMSGITKTSDQYYDLYYEYRDRFNEYDYSYTVKEISFDDVTADLIIVKASTTVSGVDQDDKFDEYNILQTISFKKENKKDWKIVNIDTDYQM